MLLPFTSGQGFNIWVALAVLLAGWLLAGLVTDFRERVQRSASVRSALRRQSPSYWGMVLAHTGFAAVVVGTVATSQYNIERDLRMAPGDSEVLAGYRFHFEETLRLEGPNYLAEAARFSVTRNDRPVATLLAEKRRYIASGSVMTEAAIDAGLFRDLYVAMGEPVGTGGAWAIRLHYKPMVRWMWLGALAMGIGGLTTVFDRRYRRQLPAQEAATAPHGAPA
jgi:cytochrome c-type biogenesis protein CcmF